MRLCLLFALFVSGSAQNLLAQSVSPPPFQIYGGYIRLSNSFNGLPGSQNALNGWNAGVAFPSWRGVRAKVDVAGFSGTNLGAMQHAVSVMGGVQYEHTLHRERWFVEALIGNIGINRYWGPNAHPGERASFMSQLGGGLDTPLSRHFAIRVQGDYRYENLALIQATTNTIPYRVPGLPHNFATVSSGLVWMPRLGKPFKQTDGQQQNSVDSEFAVEDVNSFGHYHIFANSWWSYLHVAGVEYDRHSWGNFIGARIDYVAEVLPVVILKQPSATDVWGNRRSSTFKMLYGIGISPVGMRLLWRDGKTVKPYYAIKAGIIGFNQKSLSQYASYMDFTLQQSVGFQIRMSDRWDLRAGFSDFHFSNGFMVPSNPGIDEMAYTFALSRKLSKKTK